jgi:HD-GYP domain-containing protein (c-di-GMP phosphodiesterase class II)
MIQSTKINKLLLWRLVLLWFAASVVVGSIVFYIELETVDETVVKLGLKEARSIDQQLIARLPQEKLQDTAALQNLLDRMTEKDFVVAEVYNKELVHLAASVRSDSQQVSKEVNSREHKFPLDEALHYEKFYVNDVMYIQILVPLKHLGVVNGYFEGVYKVDQLVIDEIMSHVYHTLIIVLAIILASFVMFYPLILYLNRQLIHFSSDLFKANIDLMEVMGSAIAKRDNTTDRHNYRVTMYAIRLGEALDFDAGRMSNLIAGSFLHDVGKIGIEDEILRKKGKLDDREFNRMRQHVLMGVDIVVKAEWLQGAREVIEFHHEKYDGSGYMRGLRGEEIPINARVFAIADVFDALCSERPYKNELPLEEALAIMKEGRGSHFDPNLLDKFFELAPDLYQQIATAEYANLQRMLSSVVQKYFFTARVQQQ